MRRADRFVQGLARLVEGIFFQRVEVVGAERIPAEGPLLLVANHVNSLVDPVLVIAVAPRMPRFLAKSTLWGNPGVRPFLELAGVIPVHRRQDAAEGADPAKNLETFARCHEELAKGGAIAMFPEGISHNEPELQPVKTGAARITLEAEERFGPLSVRIVPLGLTFDAKELFRSRALVRVGVPLDPASEIEAYAADGRAAVKALTERVERAIREETLNYASWDEAKLIERGADLYARRQPEVPGEEPLADRVALRRAFLAGYRHLAAEHPERVAAAAHAVESYGSLLAACGLRDDQVAARYRPDLVRRYAWRSLALMALRLPLAVVGLLLNWLPYRIPGWVAGRFAAERDQIAGFKLFAAVFSFPVFWGLEAAAAGWAGGLWWALGALVAAPLTGWVALDFHDRQAHFLTEARAFVLRLVKRNVVSELAARREQVYEEIEKLVALYRQGGPQPAADNLEEPR